jgi:tricorn protease
MRQPRGRELHLSEMISELNIGHAYLPARAMSRGSPAVGVGMLGCDFELVKDRALPASRVQDQQDHTGRPWDCRRPRPAQPARRRREGRRVPAGGQRRAGDTKQGPLGRVHRASTDRVSRSRWNDKPDAGRKGARGAREAHRRRIEPALPRLDRGQPQVCRGRVRRQGRLHLRAQHRRRWAERPVRQFFGHAARRRSSSTSAGTAAGRSPTRFIELLNRPVTNYWARRDGKDWIWPPDAPGAQVHAHQRPRRLGRRHVPLALQAPQARPLIGTRTWGGLVGISGNPGLIDGGPSPSPPSGSTRPTAPGASRATASTRTSR